MADIKQTQDRDQGAISDQDAADRTGRTDQVTGEDSNSRVEGSKDAKPSKAIPDPNDLTGPAGDPAEGKRAGGSTYPA